MPHMRVAHCIHGLGPGGAQRVVEIVIGLAGRNLDHFVYSPSAGVFAGEMARRGAVVRIIPRRLPKFDPGWVLRLATAMRRDEIDVVHTHLFGDSLHGCLAARAAGGKPAVVTLHSMVSFYTRLQRLGYRWLLPSVTRTVACSEAVRRSFLHEMAGREVRIETIPSGVEAPPEPLDRQAVREEFSCEPDALLVGGIGRLVEAKGFAHLISAFALVVRSIEQRVRLVVLGEGPLRSDLEEHIHKSGLADSITLAGFRPDAQQLLVAFDVVAISSVDEGLPMALLETMAAGRCIVATNVGGIGDAIRDGQEGLLVPPHDPTQLAAALSLALADPALRSRLGAAAARRFQARFTAGRMVAEYERLYREIHDLRQAAPRAASPKSRH